MFELSGYGCVRFLLTTALVLLAALLFPLLWLLGVGELAEWLTANWLGFRECYPAGGSC